MEVSELSKRDSERVARDAYIAIDALKSLTTGDRFPLHPDYIKQKVEVVDKCLNFMKSFYEGE